MKEIYRKLESLMTSFEAVDINFISLHADTIKSEREMVEALSRFTAGEISNEDLKEARLNYKLINKLHFWVGELLEVIYQIKRLKGVMDDN